MSYSFSAMRQEDCDLASDEVYDYLTELVGYHGAWFKTEEDPDVQLWTEVCLKHARDSAAAMGCYIKSGGIQFFKGAVAWRAHFVQKVKP